MRTRPLIFLIILNLILVLFLVFWLRPNWQIGGDGFGYYSYFRSVAVDRDLNFSNEYQEFDRVYNTHQSGVITRLGKTANQFSVGPAILSAPFLLVTNFFVGGFFSDISQYNLSGYGTSYQLAVFLSALFYFLLGLSFLYLTLRKLVPSRSALWAVMFSWLASPLIFYVVYEPSMSHAFAFFGITGLLYFSLKLKENLSFKNIFICGLWLGLSMLCRWQNLYFILLPLVFIFWNKENWSLKIKSLLVLILGALIIFWPQMLVWQNLYGVPFVVPQGSSFFQIFQPHVRDFLFSSYHGLFFWHPAILLGVIGLILAVKKQAKLILAMVIILILEIWLNAGLVDWFGGSSFGARRMIESLPLIAIGWAYLFDYIATHKRKALKIISYLVFAILIFANLSLLVNVGRGVVPLENNLDWRVLWK